ncbi:MAG: DUF5675 family protein [Desulfovibrionaceae bacterium]
MSATVLRLLRLERGEDGVFGALVLDGRVACLTLEPPDLGNRPEVSCIPEGRYRLERVRSPRFGETLRVSAVPGRTDILIHAGNTRGDTHGCILTGEGLGELEGRRGITGSRRALAGLLAGLDGRGELELLVSGADRTPGGGAASAGGAA